MSHVAAYVRRAVSSAGREDGATATEYALLVSFIALALVLGVTFFGTNLNTVFGGFGTFVANNF